MLKPEIEVQITLLQSKDGGRKTAIFGEYRGVFTVRGGESYSVRFCALEEFSGRNSESMTVPVQFLFPQRALPQFPLGALFDIWEGRVIGHGRVVKVLV